MLKKQNRLGKNMGKTKSSFFSSNILTIKVFDNKEEITRFAFVISKKIDKRAVVRNRIKRKLSRAVEKIFKDVSKRRNIVVIAKKGIEVSLEKEILKNLEGLFRKAKILK